MKHKLANADDTVTLLRYYVILKLHRTPHIVLVIEAAHIFVVLIDVWRTDPY